MVLTKNLNLGVKYITTLRKNVYDIKSCVKNENWIIKIKAIA